MHRHEWSQPSLEREKVRPTAPGRPTKDAAMRRRPARWLALLIAACGLGASAAGAAAAPPVDAGAAEAKFRQLLGNAYGESWLEGGSLVVGVTNPALAGRVAAAGARARVVRHSASELRGIQADLDRRAGSAPARVAGWYVDHPSNSVVVEVVGSDPAARAFADHARSRGGPAVRVQQVAEARRPYWDLIAGQAIFGGGARCSLGFNARNAAGARFVITAGHCTNHAVTWSGVGGLIGPRAASSFPGDDFGTIQVTTTTPTWSSPLVDQYSAGPDLALLGWGQVPVGGRVCRSGSTTGWRCGTVQAFNQTVNYSQGTVFGLTRTDACAEQGDSGGPFVSQPIFFFGPYVSAQGLTSGGSGNCTFGGTTYFQPLNEVLTRYGLRLIDVLTPV